MAIYQIEHGTSEYNQMVQLRNEILRKPLGLSLTCHELDNERGDVLIGAFDDGRIIGCCILTKESNERVRLRQMAVKNNQQCKGVGQQIMRFAEILARDQGYKVLCMHARDSAIGFYEKQGYRVVGEGFMEVTISHHMMEKILV